MKRNKTIYILAVFMAWSFAFPQVYQDFHRIFAHNHNDSHHKSTHKSIEEVEHHCPICSFNFAHKYEPENNHFTSSIYLIYITLSTVSTIQIHNLVFGNLYLRGPPQLATTLSIVH